MHSSPDSVQPANVLAQHGLYCSQNSLAFRAVSWSRADVKIESDMVAETTGYHSISEQHQQQQKQLCMYVHVVTFTLACFLFNPSWNICFLLLSN